MLMNKLLDETKNMCKYKQLMLFFGPQKNPTTGTGVFIDFGKANRICAHKVH